MITSSITKTRWMIQSLLIDLWLALLGFAGGLAVGAGVNVLGGVSGPATVDPGASGAPEQIGRASCRERVYGTV